MDKSVPASTNTLTHYGIKGMKWGVRRADPSGGAQKAAPQPRQSADSKATEKTQDKIDRGGTASVSNQELQALVKRRNLEKQYNDLHRERDTLDAGQATVKKILGYGNTMNQVYAFSKSPLGKGIKNGFKIGLAYATGGTSAAAAAGAQIAVRRARNHYSNVGGY
ncbi:hypothetical protein SEA_LIBERTYBELL_6 [Streptomyces phage LibertyBell]|nr:hypothetical protein SEA_LIBERTYBELL_6 [Streptomyces phage LibertyBell]